MTHCGTQKLETERLILRPFSMDDVSAMYRNWTSDDQVTKFLTWPAHESEDITRMILSDWLTHYQEEENYYHWGIELKELGEVIGSLAVVNIRESIGEAEIGYCLGKKWWGNGIMAEAAGAAVDYLFREAGFRRICACHDKNNPASGRVLQKIGMRYEGTLRSADRNNQAIVDKVIYGILMDD